MTTTSVGGRAIRRVLRVDAAVEAVLTCCCAAAAAWPGVVRGSGMPGWIGRPELLTAAGLLAAAAGGLWWLSGRADRSALRGVAIGNGVTAVVAAAWAAFGLSDGGLFRVAIAAVAVGLASLAGVQLTVVRRGAH